SESVDERSLARHHELRDVNAFAVSMLGILLCAAVLLTLLFSAFVVGFFGRPLARAERSVPPAGGERLPPEPRLETNPQEDLSKKLQRERAVLNNYAWIDRQAGSVRIPIERAMDLLAARGLGPGQGAKTQNGSAERGR